MRPALLVPSWLRLAPALLLLAALGTKAEAQPLTAYGARGLHPSQQCATASSFGVHYGTSRSYRRGRYETRCEQVWVPGRQERVWIEPRYEWRHDPCGRRYRVLVCAGHHSLRHIPGHSDSRTVRVWVPARRLEVRAPRHRVAHVGHLYRR